MNQFYLVGKIVETGQCNKTNSGTSMAKIKVSVDKNNKENETTNDIFEILLFRNLAETQFNLNDIVAINGKLQSNVYEKDDVSYYNCNLIASIINVIE